MLLFLLFCLGVTDKIIEIITLYYEWLTFI